MSIVLQNTESQQFVGLSPGTWTFRGKNAQVFLNGLDAMVYCFSRRLSNMQILGSLPEYGDELYGSRYGCLREANMLLDLHLARALWPLRRNETRLA